MKIIVSKRTGICFNITHDKTNQRAKVDNSNLTIRIWQFKFDKQNSLIAIIIQNEKKNVENRI